MKANVNANHVSTFKSIIHMRQKMNKVDKESLRYDIEQALGRPVTDEELDEHCKIVEYYN